MKRFLLVALTVLLTPFAHAADLQLGRDYTLIEQPLAPTSPGKIEVVEFFSYACGHCSVFNPMIKDWAAKAPSDVAFRKVPVSLGRPAWVRLASIYYALEITGDLQKLDQAVFSAIHADRINFSSDEQVIQWAASKGVNSKKMAEALASFSMPGLLRRGESDFASAKISATPSVVVANKYLVNSELGHDEKIRVTNELVAKARQDMAAKK